jgi:hypothetical protein
MDSGASGRSGRVAGRSSFPVWRSGGIAKAYNRKAQLIYPPEVQRRAAAAFMEMGR